MNQVDQSEELLRVIQNQKDSGTDQLKELNETMKRLETSNAQQKKQLEKEAGAAQRERDRLILEQ